MEDYAALNAAQVESEVDPFTAERYRQFARLLPKEAKQVLDVGCNTGRGGTSLKAERPDVVLLGLDLLQSRLDRLPKAVYADTICGSATSMPLPAESIDALVAGEFIEHIPNHMTMDFLFDAFRVLRMRGVLMLTTPNPHDFKRLLRDQTILGGSHVSQHHPATLKTQFEMAGFGFVKVRGTGKVSSYVGTRFLPLSLYGSYMICGTKF